MQPIAHSAKPEHGIPEQSYSKHVSEVLRLTEKNIEKAGMYYYNGIGGLRTSVKLAAQYHDLGKLDDLNQIVLRDKDHMRALPINHVDAGVAFLVGQPHRNGLAATLVHAHHKGLPDFPDEKVNPRSFLRDRNSNVSVSGQSLIDHTDSHLEQYLDLHQQIVEADEDSESLSASPKDSLLFRIALSSLVDADHSDTAAHYGNHFHYEDIPLYPKERLKLLDAYVEHLKQIRNSNRSELRTVVYDACRNASVTESMFACDSPVGTGKTTAIMAHLLQAAISKKLRRVIVVLPFTNIIAQSVDVYRQALVGKNEDRFEVVAAHHHRADFETPEARQFTFLWKAPIVVTTAVQFFETLASNHPSTLRKLHQLPGSAIFIDEAHAALPSHLWPQAWKWLCELQRNWNCHFVFGSGSLTRFWTLEEFANPTVELPDLVAPSVRSKALDYETFRVEYKTQSDPMGLTALLCWLKTLAGPRLLIVNTVQSAAVVAHEISYEFGRERVEHISTSLCPTDRKTTLNRVTRRLQDKEDMDWTLVATSCVEAGVDLSFHTGIRERCSLNSLIQTSGRVNRTGEYHDSVTWDLRLRHNSLLTKHRTFELSAKVLGELFNENHVDPAWATEAMRREIRQQGLRDIADDIIDYERSLRFPQVEEHFKVIDTNTITTIVSHDLVEKLQRREAVSKNDIQLGSVQIWQNKETQYDLQPIKGYPELRFWNLEYDSFLGYMAGVLRVLKMNQQGGDIV